MDTSKIYQLFHSRTAAVLLVVLATNAVSLLSVHISPALLLLINAVLLALADYLHVNPTVPGTYSPAGVVPPTNPVVTDAVTGRVITPPGIVAGYPPVTGTSTYIGSTTATLGTPPKI